MIVFSFKCVLKGFSGSLLFRIRLMDISHLSLDCPSM